MSDTITNNNTNSSKYFIYGSSNHRERPHGIGIGIGIGIVFLNRKRVSLVRERSFTCTSCVVAAPSCGIRCDVLQKKKITGLSRGAATNNKYKKF